MLTCSPAHTCLLAGPPEDIHELVALTGCSPEGKSPGLDRPLLNDLSSKVSKACAPRVSAGGLTSQGWALLSRPVSCDHRPLTFNCVLITPTHRGGVGSQVIQGHLVGLPTPPLPRFSLQGRAYSWEGPGCLFQLGPCPSLVFPPEPLVQQILSWGLLCRELKLAHSPLLPCLATLWPLAGPGPRSSEGSWSCSPAGPGTLLQSDGSWPLGQDAPGSLPLVPLCNKPCSAAPTSPPCPPSCPLEPDTGLAHAAQQALHSHMYWWAPRWQHRPRTLYHPRSSAWTALPHRS